MHKHTVNHQTHSHNKQTLWFMLSSIVNRLSFRVTKTGIQWILLWSMVVFITNLLILLPSVQVLTQWQTVFNWLANLVFGLSVILWVVIFLDYCWLMWLTRQQDSPTALIHGLQIERQLNSNLAVQTWSTVQLQIQHQFLSKEHVNFLLKDVRLTLMDHYPLITHSQFLPVTIDPMQIAHDTTTNLIKRGCQIGYHVYPFQRGFADFDGIDMILTTKFGLLSKCHHLPETQIMGIHDVRVLANFSDVVQGNLFGVNQKKAMMGLLKQHFKGQGQDFRQIRNYIEGDSVRHIDWKATSRHHRLMTKEFQEEKDQQILFLLDCGQHMRHIRFTDEAQKTMDTEQPRNTSHLDQALNAMLLLAEIANQQGDATGFISFASTNDKIVPPKKGANVIGYLLNQSFDIQPSLQIPDYLTLARCVSEIQKKRAMIILITNSRQEEQSELIEAVKLLTANKHLLILVDLYEQDLQDYLQTPPQFFDDSLTYHSIQEYLNMKKSLHKKLADEAKIYPICCTPEKLPNRLVHQYLIVKHKNK